MPVIAPPLSTAALVNAAQSASMAIPLMNTGSNLPPTLTMPITYTEPTPGPPTPTTSGIPLRDQSRSPRRVTALQDIPAPDDFDLTAELSMVLNESQVRSQNAALEHQEQEWAQRYKSAVAEMQNEFNQKLSVELQAQRDKQLLAEALVQSEASEYAAHVQRFAAEEATQREVLMQRSLDDTRAQLVQSSGIGNAELALVVDRIANQCRSEYDIERQQFAEVQSRCLHNFEDNLYALVTANMAQKEAEMQVKIRNTTADANRQLQEMRLSQEETERRIAVVTQNEGAIYAQDVARANAYVRHEEERLYTYEALVEQAWRLAL